MATPPTFVPTATLIPGSASLYDVQQADPANSCVRVFVPTAKGPAEQYIRLSDLTAYISAVAKGQ